MKTLCCFLCRVLFYILLSTVFFYIFHLNIWWVFYSSTVYLEFSGISLSLLTLHLCGGPPSDGNTLSSSLFSGLCQPWLQLIFSRSTFMQLALTPLLCVTQLCSDLLWGLCGCLFPISGVSQFWGVLFSSPTSSWAPGGDKLCLSVISEEPCPGLVVMNTCWMNVQTQSHWSKMFKKVWR